MLKNINSRQKIILSVATLDHSYSTCIAKHCGACFSGAEGAKYGYGKRVEPDEIKL